ncbi:hypothetical protein [Ligilactobacillus murinus]|uniref:hypothetical protein n=1 Tax=Ligilactobacillus murinus TaxID=1622 RepID=UPI001441ECD3|nr:hypothetical protein [Ligilactobacillus murinus]
MKKSSISLLIVFAMITVTNGCSKNNTVQVKNDSNSKSGKIFKSRSEDEQEKREIKEFYARQGLEVDVSGFNDSYQVTLSNSSLLENLRNNDSNGYIRNVLIPISKNVSQVSGKKIYFRAGDPNNVLLAICKEGNVEYSLYGK